jgi:hypothetical protein
MTGPVQVLVVGLDEPTFSGEVMAELDRLRESGTVRLLDVLLVERAADGSLETVELPGSGLTGIGDLAAQVLGTSEGDAAGSDEPADAGVWSLAEAIPVGATAAVALIEHVWAAPLRDVIQRHGGTPLDETWLNREDVAELERLMAERGD